MASTDGRVAIPSPVPGAPDQDRDGCEYVISRIQAFEKGIGQDFRANCEKRYRQYRGFKRFRNAWEAAGPNDRDGVVYDAKETWGANLHIPLTFRTVEVMVPRAIAQRPRMLVLPRDERWEENVENIRLVIDAQQEQIDIELRYQDVMRAGMIYGLGVGKTFWRTEWAPRQRMQRRMLGIGYKVGALKLEKIFDDPDFEDVDVFDFAWDPAGADMNGGGSRARWAGHRLWMDTGQCLERIQSGVWNTASAALLTSDKLDEIAGSQRYSEIWQPRMEAAGFPSFAQAAREKLHEVWEFHDGHQVMTVLDRQVEVQEATSPCAGMLPFHVYRPTRVPKEMVGIGEIEPIEHLNRELDMLRSQRRDAATIALCAGYAYDPNAIDEDDLQFGPAIAIKVRNTDPKDALFPLPVRDVPGSGYQEEQVIKADIDSTTGINDALAGGDGGGIGTATEAQLVQAAVSKRIEMKSRRFEVEVVRGSCRAFLYLDQRMITSNRPPIRQPGANMTFEEAATSGRWTWFPVGPGELQGEFEIVPEGGSMAAENVPQNRQDGAQIMSLFGNNPYIDPKQPLLKALQLFGIKDPETWLKQTDPPVPPAALQKLQDMGVDPQWIQIAVSSAQNEDPLLNPGGPSAAGVGEYMQDQGAPQPDGGLAAAA